MPGPSVLFHEPIISAAPISDGGWAYTLRCQHEVIMALKLTPGDKVFCAECLTKWRESQPGLKLPDQSGCGPRRTA